MITTQTKHPKLAKTLGLEVPLYFKREDLHPLGSHKGRSLPLMIESYVKQGYGNFVISSSGNAALAAGLYIKKYNQKHKNKLTLQIFVGEKIDSGKLKLLKGFLRSSEFILSPRFARINYVEGVEMTAKNIQQQNDIIITQTKNPKQSAFQMDKSWQAKILRQSTDDSALTGYEQLAIELSKIKKLSAVFIPTSSGTTAQGLFEAFQKLKINPQIHIVQTSAVHPMVDEILKGIPRFAKLTRNDKEHCHFDSFDVVYPRKAGAQDKLRRAEKSLASLASAIVDNIAHRKDMVVADIKNSHGSGWIANDQEIQDAINLVYKTEKIKLSPNSALAIVGLQQATKSNWKFSGQVVCLITGK